MNGASSKATCASRREGICASAGAAQARCVSWGRACGGRRRPIACEWRVRWVSVGWEVRKEERCGVLDAVVEKWVRFGRGVEGGEASGSGSGPVLEAEKVEEVGDEGGESGEGRAHAVSPRAQKARSRRFSRFGCASTYPRRCNSAGRYVVPNPGAASGPSKWKVNALAWRINSGRLNRVFNSPSARAGDRAFGSRYKIGSATARNLVEARHTAGSELDGRCLKIRWTVSVGSGDTGRASYGSLYNEEGVGWLGRDQNSARRVVFELTWLIWECDRCGGVVVLPRWFRYSGEGGDWTDKCPWWGVIECRPG